MKAGNIGAIIITLGLLTVSCNQDAVFDKISQETKPEKPLIEGAPTNMVVFKRKYPERDPVPIMYVASGKLHWYAQGAGGKPQWDSGEYGIPQPTGGRIIALAVAKDSNGADRLYALCRDKSNDINTALRYIKSEWEEGEEWEIIRSEASGYPVIQSIYADPEKTQLFAGAAGRNSQGQVVTPYAILYLDNDRLRLLEGDTAILSGAVWREEAGVGTYYLPTRGGIFQVSETNPAKATLLDENAVEDKNRLRMFMSIIKLKNDVIIAVERNGGGLFEVSSGSFTRMRDPAELTAAYTGSENVSYQWYRNNAPIPNETSRTYTPNEAGSYTVTISAPDRNSKTSAAVTIPVTTNDLSGNITINPNKDFETGMELTAAYTGSENVSYQWKKDNADIPDATTNKYTLTEAGSYTVTVSAPGRNSKTGATVTVPVPANDLNGIISINTRIGNRLNIAKFATEAITLWEDPLDPGKQLFAVGIQGSLYTNTSYIYGYVEFEYNSSGGLRIIDRRNDPPGQSVANQAQYASSLGKYPVNHLFQTPKEIDPETTFFASTQTKGLFSYRVRDGIWQWNAEK